MFILLTVVTPILFVVLVGAGLAFWSADAEELSEPVETIAPASEALAPEPMALFHPMAPRPEMKRWSADDVVAAIEARLVACQLEVSSQAYR